MSDVSHLLPQSVDFLSQEQEEVISMTTHEDIQLTELPQPVKLEEASVNDKATRQHVILHILPDGHVWHLCF